MDDLKISERRKENILHCLLNGKLRLKVGSNYYYLSYPSNKVKNLAYISYEETLSHLRFSNILTAESLRNILIRRGIISPDIDHQSSSLRKRIEDLKVALYKSMFKTKDVQKLRKEIRLVEQKLIEIEEKKNYLFYFTIEGIATKNKISVLLAGSLYHQESDERVLNDDEIKCVDPSFIDLMVKERSIQEPTEKEIRYMSKCQPWSSLWHFGKPNPLNKDFLNLTEYQQILYMYSHMYDNIRQSSDCPSEDVMNDNDACDGWFILQYRNTSKSRQEKQADQILGKNSKHQEVFIPAQTQQDAKKIQEMNDYDARVKIRQRQRQIERQGEVKDEDLLDRRIEKNRLIIERQKTKGS